MIYTIGFTKTTAEHFFERLKSNDVEVMLDIRLNNKSQLAGFAKSPDIGWFLYQLCSIEYVYDDYFAPTEEILKAYQKHEIDWDGYEAMFSQLMEKRNITGYIAKKYGQYKEKKICLLCSEPTPEKCHRRLVANHFCDVFGTTVKHL